MRLETVQKLKHKAAKFGIACFTLSLAFLVACSGEQESAETKPRSTPSESFTFFDLGRNTKLTRGTRKELEEKLGQDAIAHRNVIDLEINYKGFLKKYFPEISELNRKLNFPSGQRVDHNTVKLMYRYAQKQDVPFDYVELVFSDYTKTPLFFRINFQKDEANIVATLKTKYGQPQRIDWKERNGKSIYWKKNTDFMIVSFVPDQFGNPEYQIVIYFCENLKQLIETERKEREEKERKRVKSGKTAF